MLGVFLDEICLRKEISCIPRENKRVGKLVWVNFV